MMTRKALWVCFLLIVFSSTFWVDLVWAKYPEKPIRVMVTWPPGGRATILARVLAQYANPYLNGKLYVENVVGAGGAIGYREAAKAAADGYTLVMTVTSLTIGPHVTKDYPSHDLFDHICIIAQDPVTIFVKNDSRFKTPKDLISYAKANPEMISAGHAGAGTGPHLTMSAFAEAIGTKFNLVPYKGDGDATVAGAGGHVDLAVAASSSGYSLVDGKKLRPLLVFGSKPARLFPNVPTAKELGYDIVIYLWTGIGVPKGAPKEVKTALAEAFDKAMRNEECKKLIEKTAIEVNYLGPEEAKSYIIAQDLFFKGVVNKLGLKIN